jgi:hypothetical protein
VATRTANLALAPTDNPCEGLCLPFMEGYEGGTDTGDLGLHISLTNSNAHIAHICCPVLLSSHTYKHLARLAPLAVHHAQRLTARASLARLLEAPQPSRPPHHARQQQLPALASATRMR